MTTPVPVPQLGTEITEAELTEWLVSDGDSVAEGDQILLLTTTKMAIEIEAPAAGTITILVPEGEIATVGTVLAEIA